VYDPSSEPREFVGGTREEAVAKACAFFRAAPADLRIVDVDSTQVSGVAARSVVIAFLPGRRAEPRGDRAAERRRPDRRSEREQRDSRPAPRERAGGAAGARVQRPARETPAREAPAREAPARETPEEPSRGTPVGELSEIGQFLCGLIERMGLGSFEIGETSEGTHRIVRVSGAAAPRLAGGQGRVVDAIQLLANQMASRQGPEGLRVVFEVEGDREERTELLARVAERAAERARSSGRSVALDPMSPRDRRIVHMTLREAGGVATMSVGEGRYRQVVVVPEGAPEYEQALRHEATALQDPEP
jgi:spoIIIJ-associated protein